MPPGFKVEVEFPFAGLDKEAPSATQVDVTALFSLPEFMNFKLL